MNKPRVLILTSSYPKYKGDVNGNFIYELATRLKSDFDIYVLAPAVKESLNYELCEDIKIYRHRQFIIRDIELAYGIGIYENLKKKKIKYFVLPWYFFFQIKELYKIVKEENINIVHAHWILPNGLISVFCKKIFRCNYKIVVTIHGSDIWGFNNKLGNILKKYVLNNIDSLTVVSNAIKDKVDELKYYKDIYVYSMGVDTDQFSPLKKSNLLKEKLNIKGPFLLYVGILTERKGLRCLISAMKEVVKEEYKEAKLVLIGDGEMKFEIHEMTKKLGIENNVILLGQIPHEELPSYFATADLFILPSFSEGWPVVVMEALSCGTRTIVTDLPVFEKHKQEERLFWIVPKGNFELLAKEIKKALFEPITQQEKDYLRSYAIENFDWRNISIKYKKLILNVLENKQ
ncbi:MAG TPA: glycosyltransferase [Victivallales bacterium]|mgnify:CR=1 FL=1|nr:glycosyltransferase [Victivallales bacterium]